MVRPPTRAQPLLLVSLRTVCIRHIIKSNYYSFQQRGLYQRLYEKAFFQAEITFKCKIIGQPQNKRFENNFLW